MISRPKTPSSRLPFERKTIRLSAKNYVGRRFHFVTICFDGRRRYGANPRIAAWLVEQLRECAEKCDFFIHAYCVMPDHIHILAGGAKEESDLLKFIVSFKQRTAIEFAKRTKRSLWQEKYYDRILRRGDSLDRVAW